MTTPALLAGVSTAPGRLDLELVVTNPGPEPIYIRAYPDTGRRSEVLAGRMYWLLDRDRAALHGLLHDPPVPRDRSVTRAVLSPSRRVEVGAELRWSVRADVPVVEWSPYFAPVESRSDVRPDGPWVSVLALATDWFPESRIAWWTSGPATGTWWA